ncbi:MAG: DNA/RNA non-specific endonuclease [Bacteroidaceae bacterium]|nr:DNA/RNA non-specific endonuclease [Bacteroidaceae bacterium]
MKKILLVLLLVLALGGTYYALNAHRWRQSETVEMGRKKKKADRPMAPDSLLLVRSGELANDEQLLVRKAYITSYNPHTLQPNWVAWHLTADHAFGDLPRSGDFREDEEVSFPRAALADYRGSGYTRGHMCPAGDNKWDAEAMSQTFLLTNMCPQTNRSNSGSWGAIEQACRNWAKKFGSVYIVCGPLFADGEEHEYIGGNKIPVPEQFFKVVLCLQEDDPKAIGFVCRNHEQGKVRMEQYVTTVDEVERLTGMDFFSVLPDELEQKVEAQADLYRWNRRW